MTSKSLIHGIKCYFKNISINTFNFLEQRTNNTCFTDKCLSSKPLEVYCSLRWFKINTKHCSLHSATRLSYFTSSTVIPNFLNNHDIASAIPSPFTSDFSGWGSYLLASWKVVGICQLMAPASEEPSPPYWELPFMNISGHISNKHLRNCFRKVYCL